VTISLLSFRSIFPPPVFEIADDVVSGFANTSVPVPVLCRPDALVITDAMVALPAAATSITPLPREICPPASVTLPS